MTGNMSGSDSKNDVDTTDEDSDESDSKDSDTEDDLPKEGIPKALIRAKLKQFQARRRKNRPGVVE